VHIQNKNVQTYALFDNLHQAKVHFKKQTFLERVRDEKYLLNFFFLTIYLLKLNEQGKYHMNIEVIVGLTMNSVNSNIF